MKSLIVFGLLLAVLLSGCAGPQASQGNGRAVFVIADAAADMGAVTSVMVTVDKVSVHSQSKGWVDVSSSPRTYDLMELKASGENELLADVQLEPGTYQQMRLHISKVMVTDSSGTKEAKLPSGELKIVGVMEVEPNQTSTARFDFIADESLHVTGNGQYILAPVIQVETRDDAEAETESDGHVSISGGTVRTNLRVGMDEKGNVGVGLKIPANAAVTISNGVIVVSPPGLNVTGKGRVVVGVTDAAANMSSVSEVKLTVESVMVQSSAGGWVTLNSTPRTFDLLELKEEGATELYADLQLDEGTYNQIRLDISKVVVTDSSGDHEAKLPSGELKVIGDLVVNPNETSTATFDFIADESLHLTGSGQYIFAPVVKVETREDADADVDSTSHVRVSGGRVRTNITVGMNEKGMVGVGMRIPPNAAVTINANGTITVAPPGIPGGSGGTIVDVGGTIGTQ